MLDEETVRMLLAAAEAVMEAPHTDDCEMYWCVPECPHFQAEQTYLQLKASV